MAVERTIQGYFLPVVGLVRFSVRKTGVFSWALPTKSTPSFPGNAARYSAARSSLRCPLANASSGTWCCRTNASMLAMKALLIGSMSADEANGCPRWWRRNQTTPCSRCKSDMYTLRYMRSMPSTSRRTCSRRTSATVRGTLMDGSGRHGPSRTHQPHRGSNGDAFQHAPLRHDRSLSCLHLVGLRRSLVRNSTYQSHERLLGRLRKAPGKRRDRARSHNSCE